MSLRDSELAEAICDLVAHTAIMVKQCDGDQEKIAPALWAAVLEGYRNFRSVGEKVLHKDTLEGAATAGNGHKKEAVPKPEYPLPRINELFVYVAHDGESEGIPAFQMGDMMMPMVCADRVRMEQLRNIAVRIAESDGKPITLCRFSAREELEVIRGGSSAVPK